MKYVESVSGRYHEVDLYVPVESEGLPPGVGPSWGRGGVPKGRRSGWERFRPSSTSGYYLYSYDLGRTDPKSEPRSKVSDTLEPV